MFSSMLVQHRPGKTSEQTAWQILREHPNVNQRTLQRLVDRKGIEDILWLHKLGGGQNRLYSRNGTIQAIYLTPDSNLNLGQVVSKMGPPEKVVVEHGFAEFTNSKCDHYLLSLARCYRSI